VVRRVLAANPKKAIADPTLTPAGVMLLLYIKDGQEWVLLSRRSQTVMQHKGEISFSGGTVEKSDRTMLDTALREVHEEIGVRREDVEALGGLDDVQTPTKFRISPYVGFIEYPYPFSINGEVSELVEVPLAALVDEANQRDDVRVLDGGPTVIPCFSYKGQLIYGATARIMERFLDLMAQAPDGHGPWRRR
jgi:8-oxo-dGTP pyrophosphatase MutT (NUDIX family)